MTDTLQMNNADRELFRNLGLTGERDLHGIDATPYGTLIALGFAKIAKDGLIRLTPAGKHAWKTDFPQSSAAKDSVASDMQEAGRKVRKAPPMKETAEDKETSAKVYAFTAAELRQFVERIQRTEAEKADITGTIKEIYSEAKGRGYSTKAIRRVVARLKRNSAEAEEEDAIFDLYLTSMQEA